MSEMNKSFWIARDADGSLWVYDDEPDWDGEMFAASGVLAEPIGQSESFSFVGALLKIDLAPGECKEIRFEVVEDGR